MQEEQTTKHSTLDNLETLLTDVTSGISTDNLFRQQLEEENEDLKKRWQELDKILEDKHKALTDALKPANLYDEHKTKFEQWIMKTNDKLDKMESPRSDPKEAEKELSTIKVSKCKFYESYIVTLISIRQ